MSELILAHDKEISNFITGDLIYFEPVPAGETVSRSIFMKNMIDFPLTVQLELKGKDISLTKKITNLSPSEVREMIFRFIPKLTRMKPIKADLKINISYIVE